MVAIFVALMFVGLVLTDLSLEKWRAHQEARRAVAPAKALPQAQLDRWCRLPAGVRLSPAHTWLKSDQGGMLELGVDALVARAFGAPHRVVLPEVGEEVAAGQPLFRLERNGATIAVPAAITGRVWAVNPKLAKHPELLSADPYGEGWACCLTPALREATPAWPFGQQATQWLEKEFLRFRDFLAGQAAPDLALGLTSQDGGLPAAGSLTGLAPSAWKAFEAEFLRQS